jgi:uncharacterized protein (TIGR02231 family)
MKSRSLAVSLLALGFAAGLTGPLDAAPVAAESAITAVTVYVDRAVVTREAQVDLAAGVQEVLFAGLPASLDPDLLQVSGQGSARVTILDVRAARTQLRAAANARLTALEEQLRALEAEVQTLEDRTAVLKETADYLEKIKLASVTPPKPAEGATVAMPSVSQWEQYLAFYSSNLARVLGEIQDLARQQQLVEEKRDAVERAIEELKAPGERVVQNVTVRLDVAAAGSMKMVLAYTVAGARWAPTYDVRVASADKSITLGYSGMVAQSTGEDWKNVKLVLSTARPAVGGTPPALSTWFLDDGSARRQAAEEQAVAKAIARQAVVEDNFLRAREVEKPEEESFDAAVQQASVEGGLTSATFTIPSPADIPADNAPHKVAIATHPLEGKINHLTIPKLAELVYLRALVKNTSEFPLIAGPVNMFLDGTFVARSNIETAMPAAEFILDLGVDDGITVKRKLLNRLQENSGIVSRKQKVTYDVLITVQNNRKTAENVVVKDQLPISKHEKIEVELVAPPAREVRQDDDGTIVWTLDLKPGEKRELPLKIAVEYPTDFPVDGLE